MAHPRKENYKDAPEKYPFSELTPNVSFNSQKSGKLYSAPNTNISGHDKLFCLEGGGYLKTVLCCDQQTTPEDGLGGNWEQLIALCESHIRRDDVKRDFLGIISMK